MEQLTVRTEPFSREEKLELTKVLERLRILTKKGRVILHIVEERVASSEVQVLI